MDILKLWHDDPEEVLLDLGFGCEEPDLSGRIPARFINYQSQARGINLQVFLEAQKNRLDLESPDVNNRFRQLEVFQQVTTAFSSLAGSLSAPLRASQGKVLPPEALERRRRMGMLFRRASKKSLSQIHNNKSQDISTPAATSPPCAAPELLQPPPSLGDKKVLLNGVKAGLQEIICLSPLTEEQGAGPDHQAQPHMTSLTVQEGTLRPRPLRKGHPMTANTFLQRMKSPDKVTESFKIDEIHSCDESSVTGSYTGEAISLGQCSTQTNSCQSDNSGSLEEPFIPSLSQPASPGSELIKTLSGLAGGSIDNQTSERPGSPFFHTSPSLLLSSSLTSPGVGKSLLSSPCPSPGHSLDFDPSPLPVSLCLPKCDQQISEVEKPPDHNQSSPASPELQNITHFQSPTLPSPASFTSLSPTSSPMELATLLRWSEKIKTEDKDAPYPRLTTLSHDSEGTGWPIFSTAPSPASFPSPSPNLDYPFSTLITMSSTRFDSSGSPGNPKSEQNELELDENSPSACGGLSFLLPSSPFLPRYTISDFYFPSPSAFHPQTGSLSQSPENNQKDSLFPGLGGIGPSDQPTDTHKKEEETLSTLSFQMYNPSVPPSVVLDSSKLKKGCATFPCFSPNPSIPVCQSSLSSRLHYPDGLIDAAVGRISEVTEQSISQQDRSYSHNDTTDPASASPVQNVIHAKMDHLSLDTEDALQMNGKREVEGEEHSDTVQTREAIVYNSNTESSAGLSEGSRLVSEKICNQTEIEPQDLLSSLHKLSTETKPEELREVYEMEMSVTQHEPPTTPLVLDDNLPDAQRRTEVEPKDLIVIDSLDLVFQTSVDGSECENGHVDAFFQQIDSEGLVYWAEPIQISNPTSGLDDSSSDESPENSLLPRGPAALDSFSSTDRTMPLSLSSLTTMDTDQTLKDASDSSNTPSSLTRAPFLSLSTIPDLKPSSHSVSVQMSSSLSSHIVHRKDVPYMTDPKYTPLPCVLPLDTSTPFHAVQSWTDLQIQRNTVTKKLSHDALHAVPNKMAVNMNASGMTQRPALISLSPSFSLLSNDGKSHDSFPGLARNKGLLVEEVKWNENEDEEKLWEGNHTATMACYCACNHQCTCCTQKSDNKQHTLGDIPYSLDVLEEMRLCLQQFCSVFSNMEAQLSEDQAAVYSVLSDQDRKKVWDIEELRRAVKQEAGELEMQLNELAHHCDDCLKKKMHRLLDEQSLLCSQLRVFLPGMVPKSLSPAPNRTVATQCCLLPWIPPADVESGHVSFWSTWNVDSPRQSPPGSEIICEGMGCSPTKAEKLDIMGFLQRLKESLRHSVNTDSLE